MGSIAEAFRTGGVWMYLILLLTLSGLALTGILTITTALKRRAPWVLWVITPALALVCGLLGHYLGLMEAMSALEHATPETRQKLLARGIALSLNVTIFGAVSASLLSALSALGLGLGSLISAGKPRKWTPLPAAIAGGLGLLGAGVLLAGSVKLRLEQETSLALLLITGVSASVLVNLCVNEEDRPRSAAARVGVGWLLVLAGASYGLMTWCMTKIMAFEALAMATPEMRLPLIERGLELANEGGRFIGAGLVVVALLSAVLPSLLSVKDSLNTRGIISAILGALLLVTGLGAIGASVTGASTPNKWVPFPVKAIEMMEYTPGPSRPEGLRAALDVGPIMPCILAWDGREAMLTAGLTLEDHNPCVETALPERSQEGCPSKEGPLTGPLCSGLDKIPTLISPIIDANSLLTHPWSDAPTQDLFVLLGTASTKALDDPMLFRLSWQGLVGMPLHIITKEQGIAPTAWVVLARGKTDEIKLFSPAQPQGVTITEETLNAQLQAIDPRERPSLVLAPDPKWTMQQLVDRCATLSNMEVTDNLEGDAPTFACKVWPADEAAATAWNAARQPPAPENEAAPDETQALDGPLNAEKIKLVIKQHQPQILACYQLELMKNPKLKGQVTLRFEVGATGEVTKAKIAANTTKNKRVGDCIVNRALKWSFPAPKGGKRLTINYPFVFNPQ